MLSPQQFSLVAQNTEIDSGLFENIGCGSSGYLFQSRVIAQVAAEKYTRDSIPSVKVLQTNLQPILPDLARFSPQEGFLRQSGLRLPRGQDLDSSSERTSYSVAILRRLLRIVNLVDAPRALG